MYAYHTYSNLWSLVCFYAQYVQYSNKVCTSTVLCTYCTYVVETTRPKDRKRTLNNPIRSNQIQSDPTQCCLSFIPLHPCFSNLLSLTPLKKRKSNWQLKICSLRFTTHCQNIRYYHGNISSSTCRRIF